MGGEEGQASREEKEGLFGSSNIFCKGLIFYLTYRLLCPSSGCFNNLLAEQEPLTGALTTGLLI